METPYLASFGRRRGRRLRSRKQELVEELLPKLLIPTAENARQLLESYLPQRQLHLEIGFGTGTHLAKQAALHPDIGFIGAEPYTQGVAELLQTIDDEQLGNIRIFQGDVRALLDWIPDKRLHAAYIYYPDPWPKTRHHKRRLITRPFLSQLAGKMRSGSKLRLATDWDDYLTWMLEQLLAHPDFSWTAKNAADWQNPPENWVQTRYESKALKAGRIPTYLQFTRN